MSMFPLDVNPVAALDHHQDELGDVILVEPGCPKRARCHEAVH